MKAVVGFLLALGAVGTGAYLMRERGGSLSVFSMSDRKAVAKRLNDDFITEAKIGNYDNLLPKKYQTNKAQDATRRLLHERASAS